MTMIDRAKETAAVLAISEEDALTLEFIAAAAFAHIKRDKKGEATMRVGASHAAGNVSAETMRKCLATLG